MTYPFSNGDVLQASDMNAVGLHLITPSSVSGGTLSGGVVSITSGSSSVQLNDVFSSTFRDYRVIFSNFVGTVSGDIQLQFVGQTTNYRWAHMALAFNGVNGDDNNVLDSTIKLGTITTISYNHITFEVYVPNLAEETVVQGHGFTGGAVTSIGGYQDSTTQFTSFLIKPASGTLSGGTIRVYGYSNG